MRLGMFNLRGDQHRFSIEKLKNDKGEESLIIIFLNLKEGSMLRYLIYFIYIYKRESI